MMEVIKEIPCSAVEWDNCNLATNVKAQETKQSLFKNIYNKIPFNTIMRETRKKKQVVWLTTFVWRGLTLVIYCKNPEKCVCWHECSTYNSHTLKQYTWVTVSGQPDSVEKETILYGLNWNSMIYYHTFKLYSLGFNKTEERLGQYHQRRRNLISFSLWWSLFIKAFGCVHQLSLHVNYSLM